MGNITMAELMEVTLGELVAEAQDAQAEGESVPVLIHASVGDKPLSILVVRGHDCETLNQLMHHFTKEKHTC